jgi:hypothetical protein
MIVVAYLRNFLDKLRTKPIALIQSLKMCTKNYCNNVISTSEKLYSKCKKCRPQTSLINIIFKLFNVSKMCKLISTRENLYNKYKKDCSQTKDIILMTLNVTKMCKLFSENKSLLTDRLIYSNHSVRTTQ